MKILVTGANGFVGAYLLARLQETKHVTIALLRTNNNSKNVSADVKMTLDSKTALSDALEGVDVVIHLAARTHVINDKADNPWKSYAETNIEFTQNLAKQAAMSKVKRFIYISSIKVNGEFTLSKPYLESDNPLPEDYYGHTKNEAEVSLKTICQSSIMQYVIVRPPLIYGAGVKANFANLIKMSKLFVPLPFGAIHNKRSLIYVENLVNFIMLCIEHPNAANQTFLVSDDDDVSTTHLIKSIRSSVGMPSLLIPIPQNWLSFIFKLMRKESLATRLCGNLQVDISKAKTLLGWKPPFSFKEAIQKTLR